MDLDRASVRCRDNNVSVRIVAVVLGPWRDCRARYREVSKERGVSLSSKREGQLSAIW